MQRVTSASVAVDGEVIGRIGRGLVVLVGVTHADDEVGARRLATRIRHLRVFGDDEGRMNRSVGDQGGEVLVVSQFTLYGDTRKGRRPSWVEAAAPEQAEPLIEVLIDHLASLGCRVQTGRFRSHMMVELVNDGPVTLLLEV